MAYLVYCPDTHCLGMLTHDRGIPNPEHWGSQPESWYRLSVETRIRTRQPVFQSGPGQTQAGRTYRRPATKGFAGLMTLWQWELPARQTPRYFWFTSAQLDAPGAAAALTLICRRQPAADFPYTRAGSFDSVAYAALLKIVTEHLRRGRQSAPIDPPQCME